MHKEVLEEVERRKMKLCFLGLDGLPWHLIFKALNDAKTLRSLALDNDTIKGFSIAKPPYTPPSWTSMFTGLSIENHRVFGFFNPIRDGADITFKLNTSASIVVPKLPEILSFYGLSGLIVNFPFTNPLHCFYHKNLHVVSADETSPRAFAYPSSLIKFAKYFDCNIRVRAVEDLVRATERFVSGISLLLDEIGDIDYAIIVFKFTDTLQHMFPVDVVRYDRSIAKFFEVLDELLQILHRKSENFVLASDHGFGVYYKELNIPNLLLETIGLEPSRPKDLRSILVRAYVSSRICRFLDIFIRKRFRELRRSLRRLAEGMQRHSMKNARPETTNLSHNEAHIRETAKILRFDITDPNDSWTIYTHSKTIADLIAKVLMKTGLVTHAKILRSNDVFTVLIEPKTSLTFANDDHWTTLGVSSMNRFVYTHEPHGVLLIRSRSLAPNTKNGIVKARNYDLMPTSLALLGLPIPHPIDGKAIVKGNSKFVDYSMLCKRIIVARRVLKYLTRSKH